MAVRRARTGRDPERREQLLAAADRALDLHGPSVRMEDIAREAGVTKPILYRHFTDKGGLYEAMARRHAHQLEERLTGAVDAADGPRAKLAAAIDAFLSAIEQRPELYRFLLHRAAAERPEVAQAVGDFTHHVARRFADVLGEQYGRFGLQVADAELIAHALVGMVHQVSLWWLAGHDVDRERVREQLVRLAWDGLPGLGADIEARRGG